MKKCCYWLPITLCLLGGCINTQSVERLFIPRVSEEEAFAAANEYLAKSKNQPSKADKEIEVWVQAANKNIPCKLCVATNKDDDITQSIGYKIYWDGACRNGYAYGLGREVTKNATSYFEEISLYTGKKERMTSFSGKNLTQNSYRIYAFQDKKTGESFSTGINKDNNGEIYANYKKSNPSGESLLIKRNLVNNSFFIINDNQSGLIYRIQTYPLNTNGVFKSFDMLDSKTGIPVGFISLQLVDKSWRHFRVENGQMGKEVKLPESRIKLIKNIENESNMLINISNNIETHSKNIVERYKQMIKSGEVKNNFMNKKEYMAIFKEDEQIKTLNKEIQEKINSIADANQRERLIRAREQEAIAAQRRAEAAETSALLNNINQTNTNLELQNIGQQLQFMRMGL